jgi:hypothetical protein
MRLDSDIVVGQFMTNVKAVMDDKRVRHWEMVQTTGISDRSLRYYMRGEQNISMKNADKIAAALGYTLTGLINWRAK